MPTYTDFFNDFTVHPDTGDLAVKSDSRAIQQALKNLILTDQWERPYQPTIGGNVRKLLFAESSDQVANALQKRIEELIDNHEKRVVRQQIKVQANPQGRAYDIWIVYFELNNPNPTTFYIELKRTR